VIYTLRHTSPDDHPARGGRSNQTVTRAHSHQTVAPPSPSTPAAFKARARDRKRAKT